MKKIALVVHGPFSSEWLSEILKSVNSFKYKFNQIIIVSYTSDIEQYKQKLEELKFPQITQIVPVKDTINPGFFNINRQIISVREGLKFVDDDSFVFKLRNDQCVDFNKIVKYIDDEKIITTNCYSRKDRLYHPSDMFLCGGKKLLEMVYNRPLINKTHLMTQLENKKNCKEKPDWNFVAISPESELCRYYIKQRGWNILNTKEDSYNAIKKSYKILNSWDISFRWNKQRNKLLPSEILILPHYFCMQPFQNGPFEQAKCYIYTDFTSKIPTLKELFWVGLSKIASQFFEGNQNSILKYINLKQMSRYIRYKLLKLLPYFIVEKEVRRLREKVKGV